MFNNLQHLNPPLRIIAGLGAVQLIFGVIFVGAGIAFQTFNIVVNATNFTNTSGASATVLAGFTAFGIIIGLLQITFTLLGVIGVMRLSKPMITGFIVLGTLQIIVFFICAIIGFISSAAIATLCSTCYQCTPEEDPSICGSNALANGSTCVVSTVACSSLATDLKVIIGVTVLSAICWVTFILKIFIMTLISVYTSHYGLLYNRKN